MAKELQGEQNLESESDETESHTIFIPPESGSAVVPSQKEETMGKKLRVELKSEITSDEDKVEQSAMPPSFVESYSSIVSSQKGEPEMCCAVPSFDRVEVSIPDWTIDRVTPQLLAVSSSFDHSDIVTTIPGITFIIKQRPTRRESKELPHESDEEIAEGDAVCEKCWRPFKENENMVKMKCNCYNQLFHEGCEATTSNCRTCKQQVQRIPSTLLPLPSSDDATVNTIISGKKHKWLSLFKR